MTPLYWPRWRKRRRYVFGGNPHAAIEASGRVVCARRDRFLFIARRIYEGSMRLHLARACLR